MRTAAPRLKSTAWSRILIDVEERGVAPGEQPTVSLQAAPALTADSSPAIPPAEAGTPKCLRARLQAASYLCCWQDQFLQTSSSTRQGPQRRGSLSRSHGRRAEPPQVGTDKKLDTQERATRDYTVAPTRTPFQPSIAPPPVLVTTMLVPLPLVLTAPSFSNSLMTSVSSPSSIGTELWSASVFLSSVRLRPLGLALMRETTSRRSAPRRERWREDWPPRRSRSMRPVTGSV